MNNICAVMKNQNHLWHPNTQMSEWNKFPKIVRGEGMWLIDEDGNRLLDGVASMWCNVWGHSKKELVNAIIKQTKKLQHAPLFNLTNEPSELLAKKLIKGYTSIRKLNNDEKKYLKVLAQGASIRFLLTRVFDYLNLSEGALLTVKDPVEYLKRLEFHNSVESFEDYCI